MRNILAFEQKFVPITEAKPTKKRKKSKKKEKKRLAVRKGQMTTQMRQQWRGGGKRKGDSIRLSTNVMGQKVN